MTRMTAVLIRSDKLLIFGGLAICVVAGLSHYGGWPHLVGFVVSALAVTVLASLVGLAVDQLGDRFGPGATGVLQSALGNLPELFIWGFTGHILDAVLSLGGWERPWDTRRIVEIPTPFRGEDAPTPEDG